MTSQELATILAGLRYLQQNPETAIPGFEAHGYGELLNPDQIDGLCERLNCSESKPERTTAATIIERYEAGEVDFIELDLTEIDLKSKLLTNVILRGSRLTRANLKEIDLRDSDLTGANLVGAKLTHANLTNCDLSGIYAKNAMLWGTNFSGANLMGANLMHSNLSEANLEGANLSGVNFTGANLRKAIFTGVKPPFESHPFWGELLAQKATTKDQKNLACLVAGGDRFIFCWTDFLRWEHPLQDWALKAIASYNLDLQHCPRKAAILKQAIAQ